MAYDDKLANRIRERFAALRHVEEKEMMGGLTFMYNGKMCVGIFRGELMCRIDPATNDDIAERQGAKTMEFNKKKMPGYILIDDSGIRSKKEFDYWIDLALSFNKDAKASKKKSVKKKGKK